MIVLKFCPGNMKFFQHSWLMKLSLGVFAVCFLLATSYIASRLSAIPVKSFPEGKDFKSSPVRNDLIQVLIITGKGRLAGALALVNSIVSNTESPVHFYFLTDLETSSELHSWIEDSTLHGILYEIKVVNPTEFNNTFSENVDNESWLDYTRIQIPRLFPQAFDRLVVLNDDIIVRGDIAKLNNASIDKNHFGALSTDCDTVTRVFNKNKSNYFHYLNVQKPLLKEKDINGKKCVFNMGVMVLNITLWRAENVTEKLLHWIELNRKENLFHINSILSPFLIVFNDRISSLDSSWHIRHLGVTSGSRYSRQYLEKANLLHWDGHFKPWKHKSVYSDLWHKYSVVKPKLKL